MDTKMPSKWIFFRSSSSLIKKVSPYRFGWDSLIGWLGKVFFDSMATSGRSRSEFGHFSGILRIGKFGTKWVISVHGKKRHQTSLSLFLNSKCSEPKFHASDSNSEIVRKPGPKELDCDRHYQHMVKLVSKLKIQRQSSTVRHKAPMTGNGLGTKSYLFQAFNCSMWPDKKLWQCALLFILPV